MSPLSDADLVVLGDAVRRLERQSFAMRLAALAGRPAARIARALPSSATALVTRAAGHALEHALDVALYSLRDPRFVGHRALHSALASATGAVGGAFGLALLAVELPVSTAIMLRAIAAIAQGEGEDLDDPRARLACLEVFALGGAPADEAGAEAGYFAVRGMLFRALGEAAELVVGKGVLREGAPLLLRLLPPITARFGAVVSEKVAAQAVPIVGALGGAAINLVFITHFQEVARGHFAVRRLERAYGADAVRDAYDRLKSLPPSAL